SKRQKRRRLPLPIDVHAGRVDPNLRRRGACAEHAGCKCKRGNDFRAHDGPQNRATVKPTLNVHRCRLSAGAGTSDWKLDVDCQFVRPNSWSGRCGLRCGVSRNVCEYCTDTSVASFCARSGPRPIVSLTMALSSSCGLTRQVAATLTCVVLVA